MEKSTEVQQAAVFKALGHPTRVRIVSILSASGGRCVGDLTDQLGFDQSTVSRHLSVLKTVGILKSRKQGLNVTYEIGMPCVVQFLNCVERIVSGDAKQSECYCGEPSNVAKPCC